MPESICWFSPKREQRDMSFFCLFFFFWSLRPYSIVADACINREKWDRRKRCVVCGVACVRVLTRGTWTNTLQRKIEEVVIKVMRSPAGKPIKIHSKTPSIKSTPSVERLVLVEVRIVLLHHHHHDRS